jgi:asparagine synthase (glutamine-hydrolysing)
VSGIVGIFRKDGAPADRLLLQSLAHFLAYRGPDGREVWADGPVGFGHALLRTTYESLGDRQPASLDRQFWITADARIDCRSELQTELEQKGQKVRDGAPDSELILHSYAAWGEACVEHLRGDFAFAIWDARRRTLFCARDHFGVKPLYYADLGDFFIFSNTLDCVRAHPDVSGELNEAAIGDFLLFGLNYNVATTTFRDVQRLPSAHTLSVSAEGLRVSRYWSVPIDGRIRYRRADEYVEHFQILLQAAVADRLRISRAGILLSGGLDSSAIAAMARELSGVAGGKTDLRAYTLTYESLIPDREGEHARKVAEFLHIPHRTLALDELRPFERWEDPEVHWPEPVDDPFFAGLFDEFQMIAAECRVALEGEGSDNLMHFEMLPQLRDHARKHKWGLLWRDSVRYLSARSSPWPGIRRRVARVFRNEGGKPVFPRWIAPDFARRVDLEARWTYGNRVLEPRVHPLLPTAHASLSLPQWSHSYELDDPGVTRCPVEVRHPFMDLRVVEYLLAVPPFPWAFEKTILRDAMAGRLPESIRRRPKTPLVGDPLMEMLQRPETAWMDQACGDEEIARFVNLSALPSPRQERDSMRAVVSIRPLCLNFWLRSLRRVRYNLVAEVRNG